MVGDLQVPAINDNAMSGGYWDNIQDGLSFGLDSWMKYEQTQAIKDASGQGQKNLNNTVEVQTPQVVQQAPSGPETMQQKLAKGFNVDGSTLGLVVVGVAALWFLTKK